MAWLVGLARRSFLDQRESWRLLICCHRAIELQTTKEQQSPCREVRDHDNFCKSRRRNQRRLVPRHFAAARAAHGKGCLPQKSHELCITNDQHPSETKSFQTEALAVTRIAAGATTDDMALCITELQDVAAAQTSWGLVSMSALANQQGI